MQEKCCIYYSTATKAMKKTNFKQYYIAIDLNTFSIHLSNNKTKIADIVKVHRNTIATVTSRAVFKDFLVVRVTEQ